MKEIGYREEITIRGLSGETTVEAKSDTGAGRTSLDMDLAAEIGAGPIVDTKTFKSSNGKSTRPIAKVEVVVKGEVIPVAASLADRSHLSTDVLLGRDVLSAFAVTP